MDAIEDTPHPGPIMGPVIPGLPQLLFVRRLKAVSCLSTGFHLNLILLSFSRVRCPNQTLKWDGPTLFFSFWDRALATSYFFPSPVVHPIVSFTVPSHCRSEWWSLFTTGCQLQLQLQLQLHLLLSPTVARDLAQPLYPPDIDRHGQKERQASLIMSTPSSIEIHPARVYETRQQSAKDHSQSPMSSSSSSTYSSSPQTPSSANSSVNSSSKSAQKQKQKSKSVYRHGRRPSLLSMLDLRLIAPGFSSHPSRYRSPKDVAVTNMRHVGPAFSEAETRTININEGEEGVPPRLVSVTVIFLE